MVPSAVLEIIGSRKTKYNLGFYRDLESLRNPSKARLEDIGLKIVSLCLPEGDFQG